MGFVHGLPCREMVLGPLRGFSDDKNRGRRPGILCAQSLGPCFSCAMGNTWESTSWFSNIGLVLYLQLPHNFGGWVLKSGFPWESQVITTRVTLVLPGHFLSWKLGYTNVWTLIKANEYFSICIPLYLHNLIGGGGRGLDWVTDRDAQHCSLTWNAPKRGIKTIHFAKFWQTSKSEGFDSCDQPSNFA